jgi:hypothetical protein
MKELALLMRPETGFEKWDEEEGFLGWYQERVSLAIFVY